MTTQTTSTVHDPYELTRLALYLQSVARDIMATARDRATTARVWNSHHEASRQQAIMMLMASVEHEIAARTGVAPESATWQADDHHRFAALVARLCRR